MKFVFAPVILLTVLLAGCAPMRSAGKAATPLEASQLGLTASPFTWPDEKWWKKYQDPQLDTLVNEALVHSPTMVSAQARLARANAAVTQSRAPLFPSVDANYQLTRQRLSEKYIYPAPLGGSVNTENRFALDFNYELDFWGKNRSLLQSAVAEEQAAEADRQAARNMLSAAVVKAYLNVQNAFAQADTVAEIGKQREEVLAITKGRFSAGLDTKVEVWQAESETAANRVETVRLQTQITQLRNQIAALVAQGPQRGKSIGPAKLLAPAGEIPASISLDLLGHRPDVVAAKWRAESARAQIDAARALFYPNINLVAFAGFQSLGINNLINAGSLTAGIGPAITLPIFHGGELNANLAGRRADADLAVANYNNTLITAVHQVADALDGWRLLGREREAQHEARTAIDAAYALALDRYRAGLGNYLTVLIAQNGVMVQARLATDLRMRAYILDAELAHALGGGYDTTGAASRNTD